MGKQNLKKFYPPTNFESCEEDMNPINFRKQVARFYDGIAVEYEGIFGIHAEAWEADLQALLSATGRVHFKRVFEIGCGPGVITGRLLKVVEYCHAIDVSPEMVEVAKHNLAGFDPGRWAVDEADFLCLPPHLRRQKFDAIFFWGNGMTHIPPQRYAEFAASVDEILEPDGLLIINLRDGKEWVNLAGKLDLLSKSKMEAKFVHIYHPQEPKVGDMFECVIVSVRCTEEHEISGEIVSPPIKAYFNDNDALLHCLSGKGLSVLHDLPASGLSTARTLVFRRS